MLAALLLQSVVAVDGTEQVLDVVDEAFTVGEAAQELRLAAVRALRLALLDPGAQAVLAGELAAGRTHPGFLNVLVADVALQERHILRVSSPWSLHTIITISNKPNAPTDGIVNHTNCQAATI